MNHDEIAAKASELGIRYRTDCAADRPPDQLWRAEVTDPRPLGHRRFPTIVEFGPNEAAAVTKALERAVAPVERAKAIEGAIAGHRGPGFAELQARALADPGVSLAFVRSEVTRLASLRP